jgi:CreA protein
MYSHGAAGSVERRGVAMPKSFRLALLVLCGGLVVAPAKAADEPDLIFKRSTVFELLTPNDKLATYGLDDPDVEGASRSAPFL